MRLEVRRQGLLRQNGEITGNRVKVKLVRNKLAPPFRSAEFDILFGRGISRESSLVDVGVEAGVLTKSGTWFSYGDTRLGQGRENARAFLEEHSDIANQLERQIRALSGMDRVRNGEAVEVEVG